MRPEEQHRAQIALGACFAGRGRLRPEVRWEKSAGIGVSFRPPTVETIQSPSTHLTAPPTRDTCYFLWEALRKEGLATHACCDDVMVFGIPVL